VGLGELPRRARVVVDRLPENLRLLALEALCVLEGGLRDVRSGANARPVQIQKIGLLLLHHCSDFLFGLVLLEVADFRDFDSIPFAPEELRVAGEKLKK
jgi:hypothetical protein